MINPFNPLELLPYIREEEHAGRLIERYVGASPLGRQRILEQAKELGQPPVVVDFHFPEIQTGEIDDLLLFEGFATAEKTELTASGEFKKQEISIPQILAIDKQKKFEFTIEYKDGEKAAFITVCQIYKQHRRKGYFSLMVGAIADYCFNNLGLRSVSGSARPPSTGPDMDWRCERTPYRTNFKNGEEVILKKLHQLWLSQPYAVHSRVLGIDDEDGFALLSPKHLAGLPIDEIANLDKYHPKKEENSFVYLMRQKGVAL